MNLKSILTIPFFKILSIFVIFILISSVEQKVEASNSVLDINTLYFTNTLTQTTEDSNSVTVYSAFAGFNVDKKGYFTLGWNYGAYSTVSTVGATTKTYTSSQMGPGFIFCLDKSREWRLGFAYNLVTVNKYTVTGAVAQEWTGTGMAADFGYQFHFNDSFALGVRLNYSSSTFTKKLIGTTQTNVSYSKALIYPSLAITFEI